jgi:hypothetical protein
MVGIETTPHHCPFHRGFVVRHQCALFAVALTSAFQCKTVIAPLCGYTELASTKAPGAGVGFRRVIRLRFEGPNAGPHDDLARRGRGAKN